MQRVIMIVIIHGNKVILSRSADVTLLLSAPVGTFW